MIFFINPKRLYYSAIQSVKHKCDMPNSRQNNSAIAWLRIFSIIENKNARSLAPEYFLHEIFRQVERSLFLFDSAFASSILAKVSFLCSLSSTEPARKVLAHSTLQIVLG